MCVPHEMSALNLGILFRSGASHHIHGINDDQNRRKIAFHVSQFNYFWCDQCCRGGCGYVVIACTRHIIFIFSEWHWPRTDRPTETTSTARKLLFTSRTVYFIYLNFVVYSLHSNAVRLRLRLHCLVSGGQEEQIIQSCIWLMLIKYSNGIGHKSILSMNILYITLIGVGWRHRLSKQ